MPKDRCCRRAHEHKIEQDDSLGGNEVLVGAEDTRQIKYLPNVVSDGEIGES